MAAMHTSGISAPQNCSFYGGALKGGYFSKFGIKPAEWCSDVLKREDCEDIVLEVGEYKPCKARGCVVWLVYTALMEAKQTSSLRRPDTACF